MKKALITGGVFAILAALGYAVHAMEVSAVNTCEAKKQAGELSAPFDNCDILKY